MWIFPDEASSFRHIAYGLCGVFLFHGKRKEFVMIRTFMKEQKILPLIAAMSLPMVISMAVNALYNIVDSYFVAKISDDAMTALSLVFPIQNV